MTAKPYRGSCQCGAVSYTVEADLDNTISCNCSRCGRIGSILTFVPEQAFTLLSGDDALTEFQFNRHVIHHLFCRTCGIQPFARGVKPDGSKVVAINARCLEGVEVDQLKPHKYDGRSK